MNVNLDVGAKLNTVGINVVSIVWEESSSGGCPMGEAILGGFEHRVLLAVLRLGSEAYSLPIVLELEERTGRRVSPSKVYVTLRRLEDKELVSSRFVPPPPGEGGRDRRMFSLEPEGLELLRESKRVFMDLWDGVPVLDEV